MNVETYKNEHGEIAVLVGGRFHGVGWSTWNNNPNLAWDKRVVELFMRLTIQERDALFFRKARLEWVRKQMAEWGYKSIDYDALGDCYIEWVPAGKAFHITEYDGTETIEYRDAIDWVVLN